MNAKVYAAAVCILCCGIAANAAKVSHPESDDSSTKEKSTQSSSESRSEKSEARSTHHSSSKSSAKSNSMSSSHFLQAAASGGVTEVTLGQVAMRNSQNPAVQQFGNRMVQDHSQGNDKLMQVARSLNIHVRPAPNAEQRANIARLSRLSGAAFDRAYVKDMVEDHVKDVAEFKEAASSADLRAVRAFARETVPTLQSHLEHARGLDHQMQSGSAMQPMQNMGGTQGYQGYQNYQQSAPGGCCAGNSGWY